MKKVFFSLTYVLIVCSAIFAQQPIIAKAPPMVMMNPLTQDEASSVGRVYDTLLSEARDIRLINQLALDRGLRDYQFQSRDWTSAEKTIALGEVLDVHWVVRPQVFKRTTRNNATEIIVTAALLNIQTRQITYSTPVVLNHVNEAQNKIGVLVNEISQIITAGSGELTQSNQRAYRIGDRGPSGGWIFHDKGSYSDGWRYLEVAPRETERTVERSGIAETIRGTVRDIGSGKNNTALILQSTRQDFQIIKAAQICASMELNWFNDWFLPSQGELSNLRSIPAHVANLGGFSIGDYWSSNGSENAVSFYSPGDRPPDRNQSSYFVRAVRSF